MSDTYVRITNAPVEYIDISSVDLDQPVTMPARFSIELLVIQTDMTLKEAQKHVREGTRFRLVKENQS